MIFLPQMNFYNIYSGKHIWKWNFNFSVESTWSCQSGIQILCNIGGADHDYSVVFLKAIHLVQKLIESVLKFSIALALVSGRSFASNGIDFINKDHHGTILFPRLLKKFTHSFGPHSNIELDKFTTRRINKWNSRFSGSRFGQEGFSSSWWSI